MSNPKELAAAAKSKGNAAFSKNDYDTALKEFTEAIKHDPTDHVFYSNRSACYANKQMYTEALNDADKCVELKGDWAKGYSRRGVALYGLKRFQEAKTVYEKGLSLESGNQQMKEALDETNRAIKNQEKRDSPFGKMFGNDMWAKLAMNPITKAFLDDPSYVQKMKLLQSNPQLFTSLSNDPQVTQSLGVLLGLPADFGSGGPPPSSSSSSSSSSSAPQDEEEEEEKDDEPAPENKKPNKKEDNKVVDDDVVIEDDEDEDDEDVEMEKVKEEKKKPKKEEPKKETKKEEPKKEETKKEKEETKKQKKEKPKEKEESEEERKEKEAKEQAEHAKNEANTLYKKKMFPEALVLYEKAKQLDPSNATYLSNIAAVQFEQKEFEKCILTCKDALKVCEEKRASFETIGKIYLRIGNGQMQLGRLDEAIESYNKSLIEHSTDAARQSLKKAEALRKKNSEEAYLDKGKGLEAKERGNELFKNGKYADAISEYNEAVKRDPTNPSVYSNRAACYSKLMDWQRGLDDCETCLKLDSKFVKAYIRKAKIQHFLKQYHKALDTYNKGLELDPKNAELLEGKSTTMMSIRTTSGDKPDQQRLQEAMKDPEIRQILNDPTIQKVLGDLKESPASGQAALRDKDIRAKIEKLIAAGVLAVQ